MQKFLLTVKFISLLFISSVHSNNLLAQHSEKDFKVLPPPNLDYDFICCRRVIVNASFPGGTTAWMKYIADSIKYPEKAIQKEPQICVKLRFLILKTGVIEFAETTDGIKNEFATEAIRLIKASPKWIPAVQNGRLISELRSQTVIFSHTNYTKPVASACGDALPANIPIF